MSSVKISTAVYPSRGVYTEWMCPFFSLASSFSQEGHVISIFGSPQTAVIYPHPFQTLTNHVLSSLLLMWLHRWKEVWTGRRPPTFQFPAERFWRDPAEPSKVAGLELSARRVRYGFTTDGCHSISTPLGDFDSPGIGPTPSH